MAMLLPRLDATAHNHSARRITAQKAKGFGELRDDVWQETIELRLDHLGSTHRTTPRGPGDSTSPTRRRRRWRICRDGNRRQPYSHALAL